MVKLPPDTYKGGKKKAASVTIMGGMMVKYRLIKITVCADQKCAVEKLVHYCKMLTMKGKVPCSKDMRAIVAMRG